MPTFLKKYRREGNEEVGREIRNLERRKNYALGREHQVKFDKWSDSDINTLLSFEGTDRELSKIIGRSVQAIQMRRYTIKKVI